MGSGFYYEKLVLFHGKTEKLASRRDPRVPSLSCMGGLRQTPSPSIRSESTERKPNNSNLGKRRRKPHSERNQTGPKQRTTSVAVYRHILLSVQDILSKFMIEPNSIVFFFERNFRRIQKLFAHRNETDFTKKKRSGFDSIMNFDKISCIGRISRYTATLAVRCVNTL